MLPGWLIRVMQNLEGEERCPSTLGGGRGCPGTGEAALACLRTGERLVQLLGVAVEEPVGRSSSGRSGWLQRSFPKAGWAAL